MSNPVKFLSAPHTFGPVPTDLARPHLDLAPHFKPAGINFPSSAASSGFGALGGASYTVAHSVAVEPKTGSVPNAHLQALQGVVEGRWKQAQNALMENAALVSYVVPLPESWLPQPIKQARQDLQQSLGRMADATYAGLRVVDELHPVTFLAKSLQGERTSSPVVNNLVDMRGAMADYMQMTKAQVGDWFKSDDKFPPKLTAWLADSLLGAGMFAMTKKVGITSTPGAPLDIVVGRKKEGKTFYSIKGTNISLSLQTDLTRAGAVAMNVKDLRISLNRDMSPKTYALLAQVLEENRGKIKMVSATVPVDAATMKTLMKSNRKPIQGALAQTPLGTLLKNEGFIGDVTMVAKRTGMTNSGDSLYSIEMSFTRTRS